jgi:cap1 methyltransferase
MFELNERLCELNFDLRGHTRSAVDILDVVPEQLLAADTAFVEYVTESNNEIGDNQVVGLSKIAAFCRNDQLYETRQAEIRKASLEFWAVPDEARRKPVFESPRDTASRLLHPNAAALLSATAAKETVLQSPADLEAHISSIYDWRLVVIGVGGERSNTERTFMLSTGRSRVFLFNPRSGIWTKMEDRNRLELPRDTLLYVEVGNRRLSFSRLCGGHFALVLQIVTELRGEGKSQRRVTAVHVIDILFLSGEDMRRLHFMERQKQAALFVRVMNKPSRSDLIRLRIKAVFKLEVGLRIF